MLFCEERHYMFMDFLSIIWQETTRKTYLTTEMRYCLQTSICFKPFLLPVQSSTCFEDGGLKFVVHTNHNTVIAQNAKLWIKGISAKNLRQSYSCFLGTCWICFWADLPEVCHFLASSCLETLFGLPWLPCGPSVVAPNLNPIHWTADVS